MICNGSIPGCNPGGVGSIPAGKTAFVAQLVERLSHKQVVVGSSPTKCTACITQLAEY